MIESNIFDSLLDSLVYVDDIYENADLLLFGDFNARPLNYPDFVVEDMARHVHVLPDDYMVDSNVARCCTS